MAETTNMSEHLRAVREALEDYASSVADDPQGAVIRVWPSAWADNVHAIISLPAFTGKRAMDRQNAVWEYLRAHLPPEHRSRLSSLQTLSPDEWARIQDEPPVILTA